MITPEKRGTESEIPVRTEWLLDCWIDKHTRVTVNYHVRYLYLLIYADNGSDYSSGITFGGESDV